MFRQLSLAWPLGEVIVECSSGALGAKFTFLFKTNRVLSLSAASNGGAGPERRDKILISVGFEDCDGFVATVS